MMQRIEVPYGRVTALAFSRDGRQLLCGGSDGLVRLWSLGALAIARSIAAHEGAVTALGLDVSGDRLATAGADRTAKLWSFADGTLRLSIAAHERPLARVLHSPTDEILATVDDAGCVRTWEIASGEQRAELQASGNPRLVDFLPSGGLACVAPHGRILVCDAINGEVVREVLAPGGEVVAFAASPAHEALLVAAADGGLRLIDGRGSETYREWQLGAAPGRLAFSADGGLILAALPGRLIGLDVQGGAWLFAAALPKGQSGPIAAAPAGDKVAAGLGSGQIGLWPIARPAA
jgi:WD40 repeat protein